MNKFNTKELVESLREDLLKDISKLEVKKSYPNMAYSPSLAIVTIGEDPASEVYVGMKKKECAKHGIDVMHIRINESEYTSRDEMLDHVVYQLEALDDDSYVEGVLLQLPIVSKLLNDDDKKIILSKISADKDVDGFCNENLGKIMTEKKPDILPCTVQGIIQMIESHYRITNSDYSGFKVTILGRSKIVGMPLVNHLIMNNATVVNINTKNSSKILDLAKDTDIFVVATGHHGSLDTHVVDFCTKNMNDVLVIDVGINRIDGKLKGDFELKGQHELLDHVTYTTVPGGVGVMTVFNVMGNLIKICKSKYGIE
ncbi:MAG: tetrahydrofolate dehydrogenase/cyclohydrolase catalytic domain-containing protein [Fusobacteriaceae bacterium]